MQSNNQMQIPTFKEVLQWEEKNSKIINNKNKLSALNLTQNQQLLIEEIITTLDQKYNPPKQENPENPENSEKEKGKEEQEEKETEEQKEKERMKKFHLVYFLLAKKIVNSAYKKEEKKLEEIQKEKKKLEEEIQKHEKELEEIQKEKKKLEEEIQKEKEKPEEEIQKKKEQLENEIQKEKEKLEEIQKETEKLKEIQKEKEKLEEIKKQEKEPEEDEKTDLLLYIKPYWQILFHKQHKQSNHANPAPNIKTESSHDLVSQGVELFPNIFSTPNKTDIHGPISNPNINTMNTFLEKFDQFSHAQHSAFSITHLAARGLWALLIPIIWYYRYKKNKTSPTSKEIGTFVLTLGLIALVATITALFSALVLSAVSVGIGLFNLVMGVRTLYVSYKDQTKKLNDINGNIVILEDNINKYENNENNENNPNKKPTPEEIKQYQKNKAQLYELEIKRDAILAQRRDAFPYILKGLGFIGLACGIVALVGLALGPVGIPIVAAATFVGFVVGAVATVISAVHLIKKAYHYRKNKPTQEVQESLEKNANLKQQKHELKEQHQELLRADPALSEFTQSTEPNKTESESNKIESNHYNSLNKNQQNDNQQESNLHNLYDKYQKLNEEYIKLKKEYVELKEEYTRLINENKDLEKINKTLKKKNEILEEKNEILVKKNNLLKNNHLSQLSIFHHDTNPSKKEEDEKSNSNEPQKNK